MLKQTVAHENNRPVILVDSITKVDQGDEGAVVISGSHGGRSSGEFALAVPFAAVFFSDAGIGKDEAGISGLKHGEIIGVPVATIAAMSAETSNGRSTLLGAISRANAPARALGVTSGMIAHEAAALLAKAATGKPVPTPLGAEEAAVVVEEGPRGRIWATPGTTSIKDRIANDVICSGANSSRVFADGVLRMAAKGGIANDAGIAKNDSAVEGVKLLGERNVPAAAVATLSARLGEGLSTWNDGVISVVNPVAAARGVKAGMSVKEAARLMLQPAGR